MTLAPDGGSARATDVVLRRCPCAPAPWSVAARAVRIDTDGDLHLASPTLRVGDVPVLWLPALWLRTRRQPGLLPPRLEWRGEEGLLAGLDASLPLGEVDLELGAAARTAGPPEARAQLDGPGLEVAAVARGDDDDRASRGGVLLAAAVDAPGLLARADLASAAGLRSRAAGDVPAATVRPRPLEAWAHASGAEGGAALGVEARQTEARGALVVDGAFPSLTAWTSPLVLGARVFADAHVTAERRLATDLLRASVAPRVVAAAPVGPVRVSAAALARVTGARGPALGTATTTRVAGGAAASATLLLARRWGALRHELEPRLAAAWAGLAVDDGPAAGLLQDPDAVVTGPRAELSIASRWGAEPGESPLDLEVGLLAGDDAQVLFGEAHVGGRRVRLHAVAAVDPATGDTSSLVDADVGAGPVGLGLGQARLGRGALLPTDGRPRIGELPVLHLPGAGTLTAVNLGILRARLAIGEVLELEGRAFTDLDRRSFVAADATILLHARCRCLTVGLAGALWEGRRLPEVRAVVRVR